MDENQNSTETAGSGAAVDQAQSQGNQNENAALEGAGTGALGNGDATDGTEAGTGAGLSDQAALTTEKPGTADDGEEVEPAPSQGNLINRFMNENGESIEAKCEELAEHTYLDAKAELDALVEHIESLAAGKGWTLAKPVTHALAAGALLDAKLSADNEPVVITAPAPVPEPAAA